MVRENKCFDALNFRDDRRAELRCLRRRNVSSGRMREISNINEKVLVTLEKTLRGKSAGLDGNAVD